MKITFTKVRLADGKVVETYCGDDIMAALEAYKSPPAGTVEAAVWRKDYPFRRRTIPNPDNIAVPEHQKKPVKPKA